MKYVYFEGCIWETEEFDDAENYKIDGDKLLMCVTERDDEDVWRIHTEWVEHYDYKMFDNFEDLIEVGDLVKCNLEVGYTPIRSGIVLRVPSTGYWNLECDNFTTTLSAVIEIWKRVDDTFERVCHKKNGKWVID